MSYVLKLGSTGDLVRLLQQRLVEAEALPPEDVQGHSNIDGQFGRITQDAVIGYQTAHGLTPDGLVGHRTAAALALPVPAVQIPAGHVLTDDQRKRLAEIIDGFIPAGPFEFFDGPAISWLISKLDDFLANHLPPGVRALIQDLSKGLEGHDLTALKKRLTDSINAKVNVPLLSEEVEGKITGFFVSVVVEALLSGRTFEDAMERLARR
ncbi:hypothetical protein dqs_1928 [Azoarcus olearius]|uniref:peptidoglycan-binding domain-containing protein n=1 Tax=Azoarcus sp. (strain BH72) TaxID=418699 RepID=UPI00080635B2|nr:peptidoglycan-binding domain-containing protein [Azoarcus olearius]ANQ84966.1 hypothetical protein dqs_1928 [Azoarcus olearius]